MRTMLLRLSKKLDLKNAVHIGHSTGGGEVTRDVARHGKGRVKKGVLISSIPPLFMKTERNPDGVPKELVDGIRDGTANHRSQFYKDITMPLYGFNRPGAKVSEGIRDNWWRQGMMGSIQAQYECIRVLSETEFYDDLAAIEVPVFVMHGEDDQICPFPTTGARSVKLLKHGTLNPIQACRTGCPPPTPTRSTPICSPSSGLKNNLAGRGRRLSPGICSDGSPQWVSRFDTVSKKIAPPGAKKRQSRRACLDMGRTNRAAI